MYRIHIKFYKYVKKTNKLKGLFNNLYKFKERIY